MKLRCPLDSQKLTKGQPFLCTTARMKQWLRSAGRASQRPSAFTKRLLNYCLVTNNQQKLRDVVQ